MLVIFPASAEVIANVHVACCLLLFITDPFWESRSIGAFLPYLAEGVFHLNRSLFMASRAAFAAHQPLGCNSRA